MSASVTNYQDGGGPSGLSPAGEVNALAVNKFLNPSPCAQPSPKPANACALPPRSTGSDIASEAVGAAMRAGATRPSMNDLAAAKSSYSPTPGGQASPAPQQRVAASMQQQQVPMQQVAPVSESVNQQLERMGGATQVKQNMRKATFSVQRTATLHDLKNGIDLPGKVYSIHSPQAGERAVVTATRVTKVNSSSPQAIGVNFDDLTPKYTASRPNQERGADYHVSCPRSGEGADNTVKEVFRLESMARPEHLINYGGIKSIEQVKSEVEKHSTGFGTVYLDGTTLGGIIKKNDLRARVQQAEDGRYFVQMKNAKIDEYIDEVDKLLQKPEFQRCLTDLSAFNVSLVPLNDTGDWADVPEFRGATGEEKKKVDQLLKTPFTVHVEGEMDIMILKK